MKKYFAILLLSGSLLSVACQEKTSDKNLSTDLVKDDKKAVMTFAETKHDFGTITDGEVVSHTFEFTNTGEGDLVIAEAITSCGCTVPEYPKHPVKPGEKGQIEVKFNSTGKKGFEEKTVTIVANTTPPNNVITISATTNPAPAP
ncbi:MAG: DUF1573 domain-containing protein [Bacteroidia bacterium]